MTGRLGRAAFVCAFLVTSCSGSGTSTGPLPANPTPTPTASATPTLAPSLVPTILPTIGPPTPMPSGSPSPSPTAKPTATPTAKPTASPTPTPKPTATPTPTPTPTATSSAVMIGAFVNPSALPNDAAHEPATEAFEASIGRTLALDLHFQSFASAFPSSDEAADATVGRTPLVSWNCGDTNANVVAGNDDAKIDAFAAGVKAYGKPVMIRWFWEMNLTDADQSRTSCYDAGYDPANGTFDPKHFVAAWKYIVTRFKTDGVKNAVWVWCPASSNLSAAQAYYPGPAYVDWVGADTYDRKNTGAAPTIDAAYAYLPSYGKPIVIAENGEHAAVDGGNQPLYFSQMDAVLRARPGIRAYVYLDDDVRPGDDWALDPSGITAFAAFANGSYESAPPLP